MGTCSITPRRSLSTVATPSPTSCSGTRDPTGAASTGSGTSLLRRGRPWHGRVVALGNYDDGDVDIVVTNSGLEPALLRNEGGNLCHWLTFSTRGGPSNRDSIGARIEVWAGDLYQAQEIRGRFSYISQRDMRVSFELGVRTWVDLVQIRWPSGVVERLAGLRPNQFITLAEGKWDALIRLPVPEESDRSARADTAIPRRQSSSVRFLRDRVSTSPFPVAVAGQAEYIPQALGVAGQIGLGSLQDSLGPHFIAHFQVVV